MASIVVPNSPIRLSGYPCLGRQYLSAPISSGPAVYQLPRKSLPCRICNVNFVCSYPSLSMSLCIYIYTHMDLHNWCEYGNLEVQMRCTCQLRRDLSIGSPFQAPFGRVLVRGFFCWGLPTTAPSGRDSNKELRLSSERWPLVRWWGLRARVPKQMPFCFCSSSSCRRFGISAKRKGVTPIRRVL